VRECPAGALKARAGAVGDEAVADRRRPALGANPGDPAADDRGVPEGDTGAGEVLDLDTLPGLPSSRQLIIVTFAALPTQSPSSVPWMCVRLMVMVGVAPSTPTPESGALYRSHWSIVTVLLPRTSMQWSPTSWIEQSVRVTPLVPEMLTPSFPASETVHESRRTPSPEAIRTAWAVPVCRNSKPVHSR
jgi:hypothetical protein